MASTNGVPWITHRIQHPGANDIIVRDNGLQIPVAVTETVEPYAIAFHGAGSDHRRQASIVDTLLNLLLRQHLYRFIIPVGHVYRLPETSTDWIDVRRKLAVGVAMIRIVSAVRSTDLVVSSLWGDGCVAIPTPYSHAVLHKIVSIFGEEVAALGSVETRAEAFQRIAVEVEARFGCRFLLPRHCSSNSTVVYRILDPQCEQAQHFLSQSFADWPAAVADQLDDTLLMLDNTTRAFLTAQDIQTTDALLQTPTEEVVRDLLDWRRQQDMKEWKNSTAKIYVNRWKRMAAKHQRNMDVGTDLDLITHQRQPKVEGDISCILLDPTVKAFLAAQGITSSSELFRNPAEEIGRAFMDWRHQQNLAEITASDAKQYVYAWRRCVINCVPQESNTRGSAHFISNQADSRLLSSSSSDNFVALPSQELPLASCNDIARAVNPAVAIRRVTSAASSAPIALNAATREGSFAASGQYALNSDHQDRFFVEADRERAVAPGQIVRAARNHTHQAASALNPVTHGRSFAEEDQERMTASSQFVVRSPALYAMDSKTRDRFFVEANRERLIAHGQFVGSARNRTHQAANALNQATHDRFFAKGDQGRMTASSQFALHSPAPYALNSEQQDRFFVEADREGAVSPGQFGGSARNHMTVARYNFDSEIYDKSVVQSDRERVVATGHFVAPPRNLERREFTARSTDRERAVAIAHFVAPPRPMPPTPYNFDSEAYHRSIIQADREGTVATGQSVTPRRNPIPSTRYYFDSDTHHGPIVQADRERGVATGQFMAPPRNLMPPTTYVLESETYERSLVRADQEQVVAPGHIISQLINPMPTTQCALELEARDKSIVKADREQAVATVQFVATPRNHMPSAPYALDSGSHDRSIVHADRERVVAGQFAATPMPPSRHALDLGTCKRSFVEVDQEYLVPPGQYAASTRVPTIDMPPVPDASVSPTHGRSLVEDDWERIVATGPFAASTSELSTAVPTPPNELDSATHERSTMTLNLTTAVSAAPNATDLATPQRSFVGAYRESGVAMDQAVAATRISTADLPPVLITLDAATEERFSTPPLSAATECAASSEFPPTTSAYKTILVSTFDGGGTAPLLSAEDSNMSASVLTLAADPLAVLGSTALSFLSTEGIATASSFCQQSTEVLSQALSHWRQQRGMKSLLAGSVERYVQMWKQSVRRELAKAIPREHLAPADNASCQDNGHSEVDIETPEDNLEQQENELPRDGDRGHAEQACASGQVDSSGKSPASTLDPGLYLLSSLAQAFLTSLCLTTTRLFTDGSTKEMASALVEYRRQKNLKEWTLITAERHVSLWKSEVQERQPSQEEVVVKVDPSFEVFTPTVRSFLAAQSIANPSDFFLRSTQQLSEALVEWRRKRNLKELKLRTAEQYVQRWRRSVAGYQTLATATGVARHVSEVETSPDTNFHQGRSALSPLRESENSGCRLFFGAAADSPKGHINISGPKDNGTDGGSENVDNNGESLVISSPRRTVRSGRIHELETDPALDILAVPAKEFLASRGITTAHSLLQSTNEALAHSLVVYRRQQKLKEWTFSTAQRYIWNWKHRVVKEQLWVDGGSAKTRPAGRPPLDCDWDATRGVFVPRFHGEPHSNAARRPAMESTRRSNVIVQSSFTSASRRKITFQNDVRDGHFEEENAEEGCGEASSKLSDSNDSGERQVQQGRNVTKRTFVAPRTDTITAAIVKKRQDTGRDDSYTVDTDLFTTGADQSRGKDSDAYWLGTSGKRSRNESTPSAFERSPKRSWKVVASSLTSSPKDQIADVYEV